MIIINQSILTVDRNMLLFRPLQHFFCIIYFAALNPCPLAYPAFYPRNIVVTLHISDNDQRLLYRRLVYFTCIKSLCIPCAVIISCGTLALFTTGVVAVNTNNNGSIARSAVVCCISSSLYIHSRAKDSTLWSTSTTTNTRSGSRSEEVAADPLPKLRSHLDP